jgi:Phage integrase, N-terminal SAM-like domain
VIHIFATRHEALTAAIETRQALARGNHTAASRRTVQTFFQEWLGVIEQELKPSTHVNYTDYAAAYVLPHLGKRALQDIDVPVLNEFYRRLLSNGRRKSDTNAAMYQLWRSERNAGRNAAPSQVAEHCGTSIHSARSAVSRYRRGRIPTQRTPGLAPKTVRNVHRMLHRVPGRRRLAVHRRQSRRSRQPAAYHPAANASHTVDAA